MQNNFCCPVCGNTDIRYLGYINGKPYCRKCIKFKGESAEIIRRKAAPVSFHISYNLSNDQQLISNKLIDNYKNHIDTLVNAVCGSGKTEIVYGIIAHALSCGHLVGFAVPRRDVAIELYYRIKNVFNNNKVVAVYGGHHDKLSADIVVLTTHQLFRYVDYFNLIILDEIDAFPYNGNDVLNAFFKRSKKGNCVLMSATPSNEVLQEFSKQNHDILELNTRYHKHPLPVPKLVIKFGIFKDFYLVQKMRDFINGKKPVFIFCPTIKLCEEIYSMLSKKISGGNFVHSKCDNRQEIITKFKNHQYRYLVTTAVLERGVTVENLQVIIYLADHKLYDSHSLIQIAGRVGRRSNAPEGEVIYIAEKETEAIKQSIATIKSKNLYL